MRAHSQYGPLVEIAIEPKYATDRDRLLDGLEAAAASDPTLSVSHDRGSGEIILGGVGETHIEANLSAIAREIAINHGAPQVAYRETLTKRVETDYVHKKQTGGTGQFARVKIIFAPNAEGSGFESKIVGDAVPKEYVTGVETGINSVMGSGVLAGFPVVDVKATLIDGAFHDVDSSVTAFEIAARGAFREALRKGASILLEPIAKVEITTPESHVGAVLGDLHIRRGKVQEQDTRGAAIVINAMVPLANMFGYVNQLRSLSQGGATFTMAFASYAPVPPFDDDPPPAAAMALR